MESVDLHLHSNCSDGADSPERVVQRAAECGLAAIALTDHDTTAGLDEARRAATTHGIGFLGGTEISAVYLKREVHVVGLGFDLANRKLAEALDELATARTQRTEAMTDRLNALGVPVSLDAVRARSGGGTIGRMHMAQEIVALGHARTLQAAFDKFIGQGKRAYVPKVTLPVEEAIGLIHGAGGLAFLAHPGIGDLRRALPSLLRMPFDGLEAYHCRHSPGQTDEFTQLAAEHGLLVGGGSDCHGGIKNDAPLMGRVRVPYACYVAILDALGM